MTLGNEFKFNFAAKKIDDESELQQKLETCNLEEKPIIEVPEKNNPENIPCNFTPTGNAFRFNFSV